MALLVFMAAGMLLVAFAYSALRDFSVYTPFGSMLALVVPDYSQNPIARAVPARIERLQAAWPAFLERPVFGYGFFAGGVHYPHLRHVDNFYMHVLLDIGMVGLLLMLGLARSLLVFMRRLYIAASRTNMSAGVWLSRAVASCVVIILVASVSGSFPYNGRLLGNLMLLLACAVAALRSKSS